MKTLTEYREANEALEIFSGYDVSLAVMIFGALGYITSMGFAITGRMINQVIASKYHERHRQEKNEILMKLKELTRSIPEIDDKPALSVLNNPGEWDSSMIDELKRALYEKMSPEQQEEFNRLESLYYDKRKKLYTFK